MREISKQIRNSKGFTLVELAVVIVIIGVLAAFGVPRFKVAVEKSKAAEAFAYLSAVRDAEERYFSQQSTYASDVAKLDISQTAPSYFTAPSITASDSTWSGTLTRTGSSAGYGAYTVVFTPDGFDASSTIVDEINPQKH
jgi:prepilin-type N-terminal cleavage/methylation domain-containing protein